MNPQNKLWKQIPQQAAGYNSTDKLLFASLLKFESHYPLLNEHQFYSRTACRKRNFTSEVKLYGYLTIPLHYIGFKVLFDPFCVVEGDSSSDLQAAAQF